MLMSIKRDRIGELRTSQTTYICAAGQRNDSCCDARDDAPPMSPPKVGHGRDMQLEVLRSMRARRSVVV